MATKKSEGTQNKVAKKAPAAKRACAKKTSVKAKVKTAKKTVIKQEKTPEVVVRNKKSVLFVASEGLPFIKTGGLADVIGSLPKELARRGNYDVSVIMPMYSKIDQGLRQNFTFIGNFNVGLAWRNQYCGLYSFRLEGVTYYFIDNEYYFKRENIYGCYDDGERFAFFSKAVLDSLGYMGYYPDVINCNDWQSAAVVIYLKTLYGNKFGFSQIKTLYTIHNIEYQGQYGMDTASDLFGFPEWAHGGIEYDGCLNLMKGAIEFSDKVSTVSPTYANEIKDCYFANGLEDIILRNQGKITGILNGLDLELYNPETDDALFANYSAQDLSGKKECKRELQKMLGFAERDVPVVVLISRLVSHKGLDLIKCVLDELLYEDIQLVILGKGDTDYENFFKYNESRYNGKFRALIAFNRDMASKLYSGADILLMPSRQEPCGLSQMIACRYATIPVVRKTGGLADSIVAYNDNRQEGNGFAFTNYNAHEMLYVIKDAIFTYNNKEEWNKIVNSALNSDFSWEKSSALYEKLYDEMIGD
ncbi:MAG: glycogen synthase GlgA [Clostridia bacterium]|nr:glycogen synthase GlgA [Clostridia bacterium]